MRPARLAIALAALAALALGCVSSEVSRAVGARCDDKEDCDERCLAPSAQAPGGFCSLSCLESQDCPSGTRCADVEGGVCLFACDEAVDCEFLGSGWRCAGVDGLPSGEVMACIGE